MLQKTIAQKQILIVNEAKKHLGAPYKQGSPGPVSFDSPNFIKYVYKRALGITLPNSSYEQIQFGINIDKNNLLPGDLVFLFNGNHVSIYLGENKIIHAPYTGKRVSITDLSNFYSARRLI